jgi:hypothetical protein
MQESTSRKSSIDPKLQNIKSSTVPTAKIIIYFVEFVCLCTFSLTIHAIHILARSLKLKLKLKKLYVGKTI